MRNEDLTKYIKLVPNQSTACLQSALVDTHKINTYQMLKYK